LICRYLAGRLPEVEELMVQTRIVQDPAFRNEVELTRAFKDGLRELENRGEVAKLLRTRPDGRASRLALAAGVAAVAAGLAIFHFYPAEKSAVPALARETLRFDVTRGGSEADVTWLRGSSPVELEMRFDVGPAPAAAYQVSVRRLADGAGRPALTQAVPSLPGGEVVLAVAGDLLPPGDYEIRLEPLPATGAAEAVSYTLAVRPQPGSARPPAGALPSG
jgi:hypothetical protein